jgi:hypothetical protein
MTSGDATFQLQCMTSDRLLLAQDKQHMPASADIPYDVTIPLLMNKITSNSRALPAPWHKESEQGT